jgi:hypothetical protein
MCLLLGSNRDFIFQKMEFSIVTPVNPPNLTNLHLLVQNTSLQTRTLRCGLLQEVTAFAIESRHTTWIHLRSVVASYISKALAVVAGYTCNPRLIRSQSAPTPVFCCSRLALEGRAIASFSSYCLLVMQPSAVTVLWHAAECCSRQRVRPQ